jgi:uncharacterized membrane-anchored protein
MTISYDIGSANIFVDPAKPVEGNEVWVLLEQHDKYHVIAKAAREHLQPSPGQVLVRGINSRDWLLVNGSSHIDYGIERYFVPEGKGSPRFKLMEVEALVSPAHRLYIKRVLLDGKTYP